MGTQRASQVWHSGAAMGVDPVTPEKRDAARLAVCSWVRRAELAPEDEVEVVRELLDMLGIR